MKVLVVGAGGREHALCWKIASSPLVEEVLAAPGNAGMESVARLVDLSVDDHDAICRLAESEGVGLVVIGPEDPLCGGLGDKLRDKGFKVFGPNSAGARIEGSKVFAKEIMQRHRIPTGSWRRFDRAGAAKSYLESCTTWPQVVKADGLAAGKGVFVCDNAREACNTVDALMEEQRLGDAGREIVIEEFLPGEEVSVHAITDGRTLVILDPVMDHKQVGEGDTGPNTGGMGVYSPVSILNPRILRQIEQGVLLPTLHAFRIEGVPFRGTLFVGLMVTEAGPRVLEFNARFGDPETQAMMRRLKSDLVPYLLAAAEERLESCEPPQWHAETCVGVVAASEGYPGSYEKGLPIRGLEEAEQDPDVVVFHAGTARSGGQVVTAGGRVLCITALGQGIEGAREKAYAAYEKLGWEGKFCRRDIGHRRATPTNLELDVEELEVAGGDDA